MDYYEVTSPVVKFDSLCILISIANALNWEIHMMDIKGAYLNSDLNEKIYMHQPEGFDDTSGQVLKLKCMLYGLKQSRHTWHQHLHDTYLNSAILKAVPTNAFILEGTARGSKSFPHM